MPGNTDRLAQLLAHMSLSGDVFTGRHGDLALFSHFQPIYSLSHARVVGHEALLRARDADGQFISPLDVFKACGNTEELNWCDSLSRAVHLANFVAVRPQAQWLFLNVHPNTSQLLFRNEGQAYVSAVLNHFQLAGEKIVLEVLESAVDDIDDLETALATVRRHGCLIAIDDFGAGHSNFDRVWKLRPDIVKLDRSLVVKGARDRRSRRIVLQMVSLLHECGAMVLLEGVETEEEALLAMESDADMAQGYFFARPQVALQAPGHSPEALRHLYGALEAYRGAQHDARREFLAPYRNAIGHAGVMLSAGRRTEEACAAFMALPSTEVCYVLDAQGMQIGEGVWSLTRPHHARLAYEPMQDSEGACWSRRPYFRRAIESFGKVQVTRPYRTLHGNHTCVTLSYAFHAPGAPGLDRDVMVVCGDLIWDELD
jgi:EAL domain-containing protein (putative c-di-GMP-specific phosphodiesterase class I)